MQPSAVLQGVPADVAGRGPLHGRRLHVLPRLLRPRGQPHQQVQLLVILLSEQVSNMVRLSQHHLEICFIFLQGSPRGQPVVRAEQLRAEGDPRRHAHGSPQEDLRARNAADRSE